MNGEDPDLPRVAATLHALLDGLGALRAILLLDRGEGLAPAVLDCAADGSTEIEEHDEVRELGPAAWVGAEPLPLPPLSPPPPLEVDLAEGTVISPMGVLDGTARAVRDAAEAFPGTSVLTVGFETTAPEVPLFLATRRGEPLVVSLGEAEYEMPPNWP